MEMQLYIYLQELIEHIAVYSLTFENAVSLKIIVKQVIKFLVYPILRLLRLNNKFGKLGFFSFLITNTY